MTIESGPDADLDPCENSACHRNVPFGIAHCCLECQLAAEVGEGTDQHSAFCDEKRCERGTGSAATTKAVLR